MLIARVVRSSRAPGSLRSYLPYGVQNGLTASWMLALCTLRRPGFKPKFAKVQFCSGVIVQAPKRVERCGSHLEDP